MRSSFTRFPAGFLIAFAALLVSASSLAGTPFGLPSQEDLLVCDPPPSLAVDEITALTATFTWGSVPNAVGYRIEYGKAGFTPGFGFVKNTTDTTFTLTGLKQNTQYDLYLRTECDGEVSDPLGPVTFQTLVLCTAVDPGTLATLALTDSSAVLDWAVPLDARSFQLEYGPQGFPLGFGRQIENFEPLDTLFDLNACVSYDVWVKNICGQDSISAPAGPLTFTTPFDPGPLGDTCFYTLTLESVSANGWNGAELQLDIDGQIQSFTMAVGAFTQDFEVGIPENAFVKVVYVSGFFNLDNSFRITDPAGNLIFSSGPPPEEGQVFDFVACTTCNPPLDAFLYDINATNAEVRWVPYPQSSGNYLLEFGPLGFRRGTGSTLTVPQGSTKAQLQGLQENTWYDLYIARSCSADTSKFFGPLSFKTIRLNDLGVFAITTPVEGEKCEYENEVVTVTLANYGQNPQTLFNYFYAVNKVKAAIPVPSDGLFTNVLGNDSLFSIEFETTYNFSTPGYYIIEAWTEFEDDTNPHNDSARYDFVTALPKPLQEDFEDLQFPERWTSDEAFPIFAAFDHFNSSAVLADDLGFDFVGFDSSFVVTTHRIGPIEEGDMLHFDYRIVNSPVGDVATNLAPGDQIEVQVSTDCGESFETVLLINSFNHVVSLDMATMSVDLSAYAGQYINIRWLATWGGQGNNFWVDYDNINLPGCPPNLGLFNANVTNASGNNPSNGAIEVNPLFGTPPYLYQWSAPTPEGNKVTNLSPGVYSVTVTDAEGCTDERSFEVGVIATAVEEASAFRRILLAPNPTPGRVFLEIAMEQSQELALELFDLNGRRFLHREMPASHFLQLELDLGNLSPGLYLLRLQTDAEVRFLKLVKSR